jgi:predicted transcriptional regulator
MPVKTHVYRSLTRLNAGFEKVILEFGNLKQINYFRSDPLTAMYNELLQIRAQANREFIAVLSAREAANAVHFEGRSQPGKIEPLAG